MAVLTPYRAQHTLLQTRLAKDKVWSLDSFQGREADVVLCSAVRSFMLGFLSSPKRANVLLTRARDCLILVGSRRTLQADPLWQRWLQHVEAHCFAIPSTIDAVLALLS